MSLVVLRINHSKSVTAKNRLTDLTNVSYRIIPLFLMAFILAAVAGCNVTHHRGIEGFSVKVPIAESGETVRAPAGEEESPDSAVAEPVNDQVAIEVDSAGDTAGAEASETPVVPKVALPVKSSQLTGENTVATPGSIQAEDEKSEKVAETPAASAPTESLVARAVLTSFTITDGEKLNSLPSASNSGFGEKVGPVFIAGGGPSASNTAVISPPEDKTDADPGGADSGDADSDADSVDADSDADSGDAAKDADSGDAAKDADSEDATKDADSEDATTAGEEEKSQFPYGIVLVLAGCLAIAIFQNTAGKKI